MIKQRDMIRSQQMTDSYRKHRKEVHQEGSFVFDFDSEEIIEEFTYWFIITNKFPYDAITQTHHMLAPKRFFGTPKEMNDNERVELEDIKEQLVERYDGLWENLGHKRSVPAHFHIHLFEWKHCDDNPIL